MMMMFTFFLRKEIDKRWLVDGKKHSYIKREKKEKCKYELFTRKIKNKNDDANQEEDGGQNQAEAAGGDL